MRERYAIPRCYFSHIHLGSAEPKCYKGLNLFKRDVSRCRKVVFIGLLFWEDYLGSLAYVLLFVLVISLVSGFEMFRIVFFDSYEGTRVVHVATPTLFYTKS